MLNLDWTTLIFELLNFLVLSVLLYRFLFKPVMRNVEARTTEKERRLRDLKHAQQQVADTQAELDARLAEIDDEARQIIAQAQQTGETARDALLAQAREEADQLLTTAHRDAQLWRKQAIRDFHGSLSQTILDISAWAIEATAPAELQENLVQQLNNRVWELGRHEIQQVNAVRQSLGDRTPTAYITTAQPLSSEQQRLLSRTFSALADRQVKLEQQVDPSLALGLRARLGDMMIDNSLGKQLAELRDTVSETLETRLLGHSKG